MNVRACLEQKINCMNDVKRDPLSVAVHRLNLRTALIHALAHIVIVHAHLSKRKWARAQGVCTHFYTRKHTTHASTHPPHAYV